MPSAKPGRARQVFQTLKKIRASATVAPFLVKAKAQYINTGAPSKVDGLQTLETKALAKRAPSINALHIFRFGEIGISGKSPSTEYRARVQLGWRALLQRVAPSEHRARPRSRLLLVAHQGLALRNCSYRELFCAIGKNSGAVDSSFTICASE